MIFSVSVFARSYQSSGYRYVDGDLRLEHHSEEGDDVFYYLKFRPDHLWIISYDLVDGKVSHEKTVYEIDIAPISGVYNFADKKLYEFTAGDNLLYFYSHNFSYDELDLIPIRTESFLDVVLMFFNLVWHIILSFSVFVSENSLLLLFAVCLPLISLGIGLLIRLKSRM